MLQEMHRVIRSNGDIKNKIHEIVLFEATGNEFN